MLILKGTFAKEIESLVYSPAYKDLVVTLEPENDKDPEPNWFQALAAYWLVPPFGQYIISFTLRIDFHNSNDSGTKCNL